MSGAHQALLSMGVGGGGGGGTPDTWDPSNKGTDVVLSNGDLTAVVTLNQWALSVGYRGAGKWYFEISVGTQANTFGFVGITGEAQDPTSGTVTHPNGMQRGTGQVTGGDGSSNNGAAGWASGDIVGVRVDSVAAAVTFYKNDVANGDVANASFPGDIRICAWESWGDEHTFTMRTTEAEFSYSVPSGYTAWGA